MCSTTRWQSVTLLALVSSNSLLRNNGAKINASPTRVASEASPVCSRARCLARLLQSCSSWCLPKLSRCGTSPGLSWLLLASQLTQPSLKVALPLLRFHVAVLSSLLCASLLCSMAASEPSGCNLGSYLSHTLNSCGSPLGQALHSSH